MLQKLKVVGIVLAIFVGLVLAHGCCVELACWHEQPGTMIVVGGNSVRCH